MQNRLYLHWPQRSLKLNLLDSLRNASRILTRYRVPGQGRQDHPRNSGGRATNVNASPFSRVKSGKEIFHHTFDRKNPANATSTRIPSYIAFPRTLPIKRYQFRLCSSVA